MSQQQRSLVKDAGPHISSKQCIDGKTGGTKTVKVQQIYVPRPDSDDDLWLTYEPEPAYRRHFTPDELYEPIREIGTLYISKFP